MSLSQKIMKPLWTKFRENLSGLQTIYASNNFQTKYILLQMNKVIKKVQSTPVNSYPDNSDFRSIRMYLRPPFRDDQSNIISLIRISHYSYYFIRSLAIRIRRRIQMYQKNLNTKEICWPNRESCRNVMNLCSGHRQGGQFFSTKKRPIKIMEI